LVGSGGREHALAWKLAASPLCEKLVVAPGNPGIAGEPNVTCIPVDADAVPELVAAAVAEKADLVVCGPEVALCAGLGDAMRAAGLPFFGPSRAAAEIEGSKAFAKRLMYQAEVPTAAFGVFDDLGSAEEFIDAQSSPLVVKADGLAAGKGVVVAHDADEARAAARAMLEARRFGDAGATVVIEHRITGREVSVLALTDGARLEVLPAIEDHKTIFDADRGPNTGGMGTVSPAWITDAIAARIRHEILEPTLRGLRADAIEYRGVLFAGVMVEPWGAPYLLEYNCRFGDPEIQPVVARMRGDLGAVLLGAARGEMPVGALAWDARVAVCVVVAAAGYPDAVRVGDPINGLGAVDGEVCVFHAGTARRADGQLVSAGGRVLGVTALGLAVDQARTRAYAAVDRIELDGKQVRRDIGARPMIP